MPRICAGSLKGRMLKTPGHLRPTEGKVRQALFNILGEAILGARVVDGYAGSGALGIEALSRGAAHVIFIEQDRRCLQAVRANLDELASGRVEGTWELKTGDVSEQLVRLAHDGLVADLVFLDPPYKGEEGKKSLNAVASCVMLAASGLLCIEHARRDEPSERIGPLALMKRHRYGETVLSFYQLVGGTLRASGLGD